jgi:hypothetical protein
MPSSPQYAFYRGPEFLKLPRDPQTWIVRPLIPTGGWVSLYGQPKKARKSYFAIGLACAISSRQPTFLGFPIVTHGPVLYLQVDTPHTLWTQRLDDLAHAGFDLSNVWFSSTQTAPYPFDIAEHEDILHAMIQKVGARPILTVFDTAASMHTLDENSNQEMGVFMHALSRAAGHQAKLLVSHDSKSGGQPARGRETTQQSPDHGAEGGSLMRGNRGASAIAGAVDTVIKISPKGFMYYQGRAVGEQHKRLRFEHVHNGDHPCPHPSPEECMGWMWTEDVNPVWAKAQELLATYQQGSERSLARMLARICTIDEERARAVLRKVKLREEGGWGDDA